MKRFALALILASVSASLAGCEDDPRASLRIVRTSTRRVDANDRRIVLDIDVEASEGLGGSIGTYCLSVQFPGDRDYRKRCHADLEDGDTKSFHYVTEKNDIAGGVINVAIRVGDNQGGIEVVPVPP